MTQGDPWWKREQDFFLEIITFSAQFNDMPLTWLDKQPCPCPKDKGEALSLAQWLSQHQKPANSAPFSPLPYPRERSLEKANLYASSTIICSGWFASWNDPSLSLIKVPGSVLKPFLSPFLSLRSQRTWAQVLSQYTTYKAAQTICFQHRRPDSDQSYSHSAVGLCKNPQTSWPTNASSVFPRPPRVLFHKPAGNKNLCFGMKKANLFNLPPFWGQKSFGI